MSMSLWDYPGELLVEVKESRALLDPEQQYTFTLVGATLEKDVVASMDAPEEWRWKELADLKVDKGEVSKRWLQDRLITEWETGEGDDSVVIRERWRVDRLNISANDPRFESRAVTFAKAVGLPIEPNRKVDLKKLVSAGMSFTAQPEEQKDRSGKGTGYHQINLHTIRGIKTPTTEPTRKVERGELTDEQRAAVLDALGTWGRSQQEDMSKLVSANQFALIDPFMKMCERGEISYAK